MEKFDGLPFVLSWELTLECNLNCSHCGSSAGYTRVNELTLEESLAICDQFPDLLVQEVDFTGGEPLLSPHLLKIARHINKLDILMQLITNGLLLKPDIIGKIKETGISAIGVSLDGIPETHDYIRGDKGLFQRVLAGIENAHNGGFDVTVITTVNPLNINELPAMIEILKSIGVNRWQVQPVFPMGRSLDDKKLHLTEQTYLKFGSFIRDWSSEAKKDGMQIETADSYGYFTNYDQRNIPFRGCPAGLVTCGITSDGKIKGCLSLPDDQIEGDLRKTDLWDIWFNPNAFSYTRQFSPNDIGSNCISCEHIEQCKGGCSAMSYSCTEAYHNDPFCFYRLVEK